VGQDGRPSKSLTLDQAVAVITTAKTLPVLELRPGLKDVRRPAELMYAYIVLSLLCGIRTEEARALRWAHVDLDGDPAARPPVPPHVAVWRSVRAHCLAPRAGLLVDVFDLRRLVSCFGISPARPRSIQVSWRGVSDSRREG
jgi:hypothetical protein